MRNHNYSITFYLTHCVFWDNHTKMMIETGRERWGLYYLESKAGNPYCVFQVKKRDWEGENYIM